MDKCPFCQAETRPGDNFCLNCGNRLLSATPSQQQAQPGVGENTLPAPDEWPPMPSQGMGVSQPAHAWSVDESPKTLAADAPAAFQADASHSVGQATMDKIDNPARFVLQSDSGEVLQEYPLDKYEISIGRAPNSDILLSKDKLTSRRHATLRYEDGQYVLRDERSANGTFVNGQQLEEMAPHVLQNGDHVGIGEHELVFHAPIPDLPTIAVNPPDYNFAAKPGVSEQMTVLEDDTFGTRSMNGEGTMDAPQKPPASPSAAPTFIPTQTPVPTPVPAPAISPIPSTPAPVVAQSVSPAPQVPITSAAPLAVEGDINFNRLTSLPQPTLPDVAPLMAALSTLDGQVASLQQKLSAAQEAIHNHESDIAQTTNQLRASVRQVSDRMDKTIADVARSREQMSWAELVQLMEDVMNNPRDIEYVTKLARKARELNKVFQIHNNVLNTLAECHSLLRSIIGDNK